MKKLLGIVVLGFLFSGNANSKQVDLSCEISKFFAKELVLEEEKQIPLSKIDKRYLKKVTISFDMDKQEFLGSNLIYPDEYKKVLFTDDEIYFMTKGFKNKEDLFYYDTRLNRISGELTRTVKATETYVKQQLEANGKPILGWKRTQVYQCKVVDRLL